MIDRRVVVAALWLGLLCVGVAPRGIADDGRHILWRIDGPTNTIYLLGSVHVLRASDHPLPVALDAAYADADALIMELDMDDLDPLAMQLLLSNKGRIADGRSLRELLGSSTYREAAEKAAAVGVNLDMLGAIEPWYAAMTILQLQLLKLGFNPLHGVEMYFTGKATADGKEITGLETAEYQLDIFDRMPTAVQREFLLKTLDDVAELDSGLAELVDAWKGGDIDELEEALLDGFEDFPGVYQSLVVQRNRAWAGRVEQLTRDTEDYLVIVGALHLIGKDGMVKMLRERGLEPSQQ